ncbi:hypothetical protein MNBD_GAMMA15-1531 [hydrothermal vent metagenome]|uniref:CENP-V/GFA domain-containing protein n=1 Tax=hydrothermal vent metagenome TaxID=652676 RepID=A0A3B0YQL7_9ZZZZ
MYTGHCLCSSVQFEIHGAIRDIVCCHCSLCRHAQGSAFATNGIVEATTFKLVSGESNLSAYESSPGQTRYFCKTCGSPIISKNTAHPGQIRVRVGTISSDIEERPSAHIFVNSKANWETLCDDLPRYYDYEPERGRS